MTRSFSRISFYQNHFYSHKRKAFFAAFLFLTVLNASGQFIPGPFEQSPGRSNPLNPPVYFPQWSSPIFADLDRDGDKDMIVGSYQNYSNSITYYLNEGSATTPLFTEQEYSDNPFYGLVYNYPTTLTAVKPTLGDFDGDGDLDAVVGNQFGSLKYLKNVTNYSASTILVDYQLETATWDPIAKTGNPFKDIFAGYYSAPFAIDFDSDSDVDLVLGTFNDGTGYNATMHLYSNDGNANFTHSLIEGVNPTGSRVTPTVTDFNEDGDLDIITGDQDGVLRYFENDGDNTFTEIAGWDVFSSYDLGTYLCPAFEDLNNDGRKEAIFGRNYPSGNENIVLLQNNGGNVYEHLTGLHGPFGGIDVVRYATPYFDDVDHDGDQDILIGNNNYFITYLRNDDGVFNEVPAESNPFSTIITEAEFSLSYVDLNGDGNKDIVGGSTAGIQYFVYDNGVYTEIPVLEGPFKDITTTLATKTDFADIDKDGDLDLFLSDQNPDTWMTYIRYFENTGTNTAPVFTETLVTALNSIEEEYNLHPRLVDFDHDGDLDLTVSEDGQIHIEFPGSNEFMYFENIGTASTFEFEYKGSLIPAGSNAEYFSPAFVDWDHDGDLDIFQGDMLGYTWYYKNQNPPPVLTINTDPIEITSSIGSYIIDNNATLTDSDNDDISKIEITISNFNVNDTLTFTLPVATPQPVINYEFDDASGTLLITGKASASFYQDLLRTLTYHFDETNAPAPLPSFSSLVSDAVSTSASSKTITIQVLDVELTNSPSVSKTISVAAAANTAPVILDASINVNAGYSTTLDLIPLISDADNNLDLTSLNISVSPPQALSASIDNSGVLTVSYVSKAFTGVDQLKVNVCDNLGLCAENTVTINVLNTAPTLSGGVQFISSGKSATVDLTLLASDAENNLDWSTATVQNTLASGATTQITTTNLLVDYSNIVFIGEETLTLQVCDITGACATGTLNLSVVNMAPVFDNATLEINAGTSIVLNTSDLINDVDGNIRDASFAIVNDLSSNAQVSISNPFEVTIDYTGLNFTGTETLTLRICDFGGACDDGIITINVPNTAPVIADASLNIAYQANATLDLMALISDAENNINPSSIGLVSPPASGAVFGINSANILSLDYSNTNFSGTETIEVLVCDLGNLCSQNIITLNVEAQPNTAPVITDDYINLAYKGLSTVNLAGMISDNENNVDLASLQLLNIPSSGSYSINSNHELVIDYSSSTFAGSAQVNVQICDLQNACAQNTITVTVNNGPPVIEPEPVSTQQGSSLTINLADITSDPDNNLNDQSFEIISQPISNAQATIINGVLVLNYTGITFSGNDHLRIRVCDEAGACTEQDIFIEVTVEADVIVYNAVAPKGSSERNRYLHIENLPDENTVTIYNRWGDVVYKASGYSNESKRFDGVNSNNGAALPSGTYLYKIEYEILMQTGTTQNPVMQKQSKTLTGYLSLQQ